LVRPVLFFFLFLIVLSNLDFMVGHAATLTVPAGGDLQAAIIAAQPGDTIIVEAGATFSGTFHLPLKAGAEYVTIQSSRLAELPQGQRVTPAQSYLMPKIVTPGLGNPALHTVAGAHHYRILGIEFAPADAGTFTYELVTLGYDGESQDTIAEVPHHLTFDRCYIHAFPEQSLKRGLTLNSAHTDILNSYISGFKATGQDTQAILGWNGPGPFKIINNYLEASGENVMFGSGDPSIAGLVPSDIEIRRNHFYKPLEWRGLWMVKNLLELKNAQRVTIEGNVFENCWSSGQNGLAIVMTPRNQYGTAPWSVVQNIQFVNNIVRHVANAFYITGRDDIFFQTTRTNHITIRNNVFEDISSPWTSTGQTRFLTIIDTDEVVIDHNTIFQEKSVLFGFGGPNTNFRYSNNISHYGEGIQGDAASVGNGAIAAYFPGSTITANILTGGATVFWDGIENHYPAGNFYPGTMQDVGFVNYNAGTGGNYRLSASSPYRARGTDGTDLGANIDALEAAQAGNTTTPPPPVPPPPPTPTPSPEPTPDPTPTPSPTPTPEPEPAPEPTPTPSPTPTPEPEPAPGPTPTPSPTPMPTPDPAPEPIDDARFFVRQHYVDFLNREPDASGLDFWTNQITVCGSDTNCVAARRVNVSAAYFLSIEFQKTGYLIYLMQKASFGNMPRYQEFLRDTQQIGSGVIVGAPGWEALLEANKLAFIEEWVSRAAFRNEYDPRSDADFVDLLFTNAGIVDVAARDVFLAGLQAGTETRSSVLRKMTENQSFSQKEFNSAFVLMQYFGYLRRNPDDAPDNNLDGFNFWLNKLNQFNSNFVAAEMVEAFISSTEYRRRFGQP
jgi:Right handed beta helix region